jgi:hypothetical protein
VLWLYLLGSPFSVLICPFVFEDWPFLDQVIDGPVHQDVLAWDGGPGCILPDSWGFSFEIPPACWMIVDYLPMASPVGN